MRLLTERARGEEKSVGRVRPALFPVGHRQPADSPRSRKLIEGFLKGKNDNEAIPKPLTF